MRIFGAGAVWQTQTTDAAGAPVLFATPLLLGVIQNVDVEIKRDLKPLYGSNEFPEEVAGAKSSVTGKASFANLSGRLLESVFGQSSSAGIVSNSYSTIPVIIPDTPGPYTVTPVVPSSGTWDADLGVVDTSTGRPMTRVVASPAAGEYMAVAGVYTFNAADKLKPVLVAFRYKGTSTVARTGVVYNQAMGQVPSFLLDIHQKAPAGGYLSLRLFKVVTDGLKMGFKNDDWNTPEMGFQAFADQAGRVLEWGTSE